MSNTEPMESSRDQIRGSIFASKKLKTKIIDFFGTQIEIRQNSFGQILEASSREDRESAVVEALIANAYVPNTDVKVFEEGDVASLKELPFGADFMRVNKAIEELTEVNFLDKKDS